MENSSESKELGQRNQSEVSGEQLSEPQNISEQVQPLRQVPIYPFQMGYVSGEGLQPTHQNPRTREGLTRPTNYFSQRPLQFNIHPNQRIQSYPFRTFDTLPHYQHSHPYHQLPIRPIGQQQIQAQLQPQYSIITPYAYVMNRTPGTQFLTTAGNIPDLSAQSHLSLQPQNNPQQFQDPTMLSKSEGQYGSGREIYNVQGGEEALTTNHPVVAMYDKEKGHARSSSANTNISTDVLSVELDSDSTVEFSIICKEGEQKKVLAIKCDHLNLRRQIDLLSIIKYCPNVEELKLKLKTFRPKTYKPDLMSFTNESFECSPLKNLITFEFISYIICRPNHSSGTFKTGMKFFENVFKEIVKASGNLKHLVIRTCELVGYLEAMAGHLEIANKFNQLHTLRLGADTTEDEPHDLVNMNALLKFLPIVSSSLEILHLCRFNSIDLSRYPSMAKLKTFINQGDIEYSTLNISTTSLPQLRNLIFVHERWAYLNVEVGWPFNEDILKPEQVGNRISEEIIPSPLNVVLSANWKLVKTKEALDQFLQKISQARVSALFIDLSRFLYKDQDMDSMIKRISRYVRDTPSLKRCLIRTADASEGPPKVTDVMQLR